MAETFVNVTEGSGKKLHTFNRTIGANDVHDEGVFLAEHNLATYNIFTASVSTATAASHLLQIMAGGSLNVYVRRILMWQNAAVTAAAIDSIEIYRLTTAGTGGTSITPAPRDTTDSASGATAMTLPTVKGTEGTLLDRSAVQWTQTIATQTGGSLANLVGEWDYDHFREKAVRIAAGTSNGIAVKNPTARAGGSVILVAHIIEASW